MYVDGSFLRLKKGRIPGSYPVGCSFIFPFSKIIKYSENRLTRNWEDRNISSCLKNFVLNILHCVQKKICILTKITFIRVHHIIRYTKFEILYYTFYTHLYMYVSMHLIKNNKMNKNFNKNLINFNICMQFKIFL